MSRDVKEREDSIDFFFILFSSLPMRQPVGLETRLPFPPGFWAPLRMKSIVS